MNSSGLKEMRPGPIAILSTVSSRRPFGPATTQVARAAISAGTLSAAGDALQRLPASDARPCTWVEPIRLALSTTPGQARRRASHSPITAPGGGGGVEELPGKRPPPLPRGRADQMGALDHPGPGPPQGFAFADHGAG